MDLLFHNSLIIMVFTEIKLDSITLQVAQYLLDLKKIYPFEGTQFLQNEIDISSIFVLFKLFKFPYMDFSSSLIILNATDLSISLFYLLNTNYIIIKDLLQKIYSSFLCIT